MEKPKLPRHVAEALEEAKGRAKDAGPEWVAWCIPNEEMKGIGEFWGVLYDFGNKPGGFFKLIDALRYGYEIETEPITVTVTAEMQNELRKVYNDSPRDERVGIRYALTALDLKIHGVNA